MRQFVISDIHGCLKTFKKLLASFDYTKEDELYLLGDYIDRGPDSKGVIDHIWELQAQGYQVHCLKGNHEEMMIDALKEDTEHFPFWYRQGGKETLESFHCHHPSEIEDRYWQFLNNLPHYFEVGRYILVHAGLNFRAEAPLEDKTAMLWIRNWYEQVDKAWLGDRIIVHGHTPTTRENIDWLAARMDHFRVMVVDNGCVYKDAQLGTLCGLELKSQEVSFQQRVD